MSSVDSALNSSSTLIVIDFIKPRKPELTEADIARYGRITTIILMVVAALWAPQIQNFTGLWDYLQQMFSILVPPIAVIFLIGVFYKRGNGHGAFWTLCVGTGIGVLLFILGELGLWSLHYTMNVGVLMALCVVIFVVVSRMTAPPTKDQIEMYTYRKELISDGMEGLPWYKDYRFHMAILVFLIAYILIVFW